MNQENSVVYSLKLPIFLDFWPKGGEVTGLLRTKKKEPKMHHKFVNWSHAENFCCPTQLISFKPGDLSEHLSQCDVNIDVSVHP